MANSLTTGKRELIEYMIKNFEANYIKLEIKGWKPKTVIVEVISDKAEIIGEVKFYPPFRKYSFFPEPNTVYEEQCLKDIRYLLQRLEYYRRAEPHEIKIKHGNLQAINKSECLCITDEKKHAHRETHKN